LSLRLPRRVGRFDAVREAQRCEGALGLTSNALVNAVQLGGLDGRGDGLSAGLARRAVDVGEAAARRLDPRGIIDASPARRAGIRLAIVALVLALGFIATPWLGGRTGLHVAAVRYLDPVGDHPPASWIDLQLTVVGPPAVVGEPVRLRIVAAGDAPEAAQLVVDDGVGRSTLPVQLDADGDRPSRGETRLSGLEQPVRVVARGGGGRSRWMTLRPVERPRVRSVDLAIALGERRLALRWPPAEPIRARVGATLILEVQSNRPDARLDHEAADNTRMTIPVRPGRQSIAAPLVTPEGLRSRRALRLSIEGLSEAELASLGGASEAAMADDAAFDMTDLVAADALPSATAAGEPRVAMAAALEGGQRSGDDGPDAAGEGDEDDGDGREGADGGQGDPASTDGGGRSGDAGFGRGGEGPDGAAPTGVEAVGAVLETMRASEAEARDVRRSADRAPPGYRGEVAAYFLRIIREAPAAADRPAGD
jgi:hypothetical protein